MILKKTFAAAAILATALAAFAQQAAQTYPIKLHRVDKVGDTWDVKQTAELVRTSTITEIASSRPPERKTFSVELNGRIKVTKVNAAGRMNELTLTVTRFVSLAGNKELIAPGKVIKIERRAEKTVATVDGKEVTSDIQEVLEVFYPADHRQVTDDDIYGTKEPQKVGDKWTSNSEASAKDAASEKVTLDPKNIKGEVLLKGVEKVGGVDALRIEISEAASAFQPQDVPPAWQLQESQLRATQSGLYPVDASLRERETETTTQMQMRFRSTQGASIMEIKMSVRRKIFNTPVAN